MSPARRFFIPAKGLAGPCRQRGVTLIELMVALVIGLLVTAAMLKVYVDASRMYRFNEGLARVQENGRFAIEFTRRAARVAGFWGCYSELSINNHISTGAASLIGTTHQPGIIANGGHV
ncbi:MAG: prepilin-type N-terminal cleavage/methylation domain-containing protein, partial [Arenicellales bacterium]|nr:prepilin-type N-terminal cleavage/methylation domain-containing protein [Arenicellales bacterium]MEE1568074.1 prepilin-type N-terminal cleavage/methylation domain-containing protein [Arenicellales bacterium]